MKKILIEKIISGGQTGVDRAALDAAIALGIPHGGSCPKGRLAENDIIPPLYQLQETPSSLYEERTEWNVKDSDGTLIITTMELTGGTLYTLKMLQKHQKPWLIFDAKNDPVKSILEWLEEHQIKTLNIAGPRESEVMGIYEKTYKIISKLK